MSNVGAVTGGRRFTQAGASHSCERPTSISPAPSAHTTSVALARSDATRIVFVAEGGDVTARSKSRGVRPRLHGVRGAITPVRRGAPHSFRGIPRFGRHFRPT